MNKMERPIETPICQAGTVEVATRVNMSIGLTSGTREAHTKSGLSGSCNAKIESMYRSETPICQAGTVEVATRVNMSIGLTSGTREAHTKSGLSGSCNAKIESLY